MENKKAITVHYLKILPCYFEDSKHGIKPWEIRKNDRDFCVGDYLLLKEYIPQAEPNIEAHYTGNMLCKQITAIYSLPEYLKDGYVILSLKDA